MAKNEDARIKLFNTIKKDKNEVEVGQVISLFLKLFMEYFEVTETGKAIKKQISEEDYICYVTGFVNSFMSSLYCSASKSKTELLQRMNLVKQTNSDVLKKMIFDDRDANDEEDEPDAKSFC